MTISSNYSFKPQQLLSARVVSVADISGVYLNGPSLNGVKATLTLSSSVLTIDEVTLKLYDRLLLTNQTNVFENGVYFISLIDEFNDFMVLERTPDLQSSGQVQGGYLITIMAGSLYGGIAFSLIEPLPLTVGIDPIYFASPSYRPSPPLPPPPPVPPVPLLMPPGFIIYGYADDEFALTQGWLRMKPGTIGKSGSVATVLADDITEDLFYALWNQNQNGYLPVYPTRGSDAITDFSIGRTIYLPAISGRTLTGVCDKNVIDLNNNVFTASTLDSKITMVDLDLIPLVLNYFAPYQPVVLTTTGTLPAPLSEGTVYYILPISNGVYRLATTSLNAATGVYITLTTIGLGTHFINPATNITSEIVPGLTFGSQSTALDTSNMAQHLHAIQLTATAGGPTTFVEKANTDTGGPIGYTGLGENVFSLEFNLMQPMLGAPAYIKL